jgi:hypothetical protein
MTQDVLEPLLDAALPSLSSLVSQRLGDEERRHKASSPSTSGKTHKKTSVIQTRR